MIQPTTLNNLASAPDKRAFLQTLLKQVVGSKQRKESLLRAGGIDNLLALLTPRSHPNPEEDLSTEAAAVLAAISLPTLESVRILGSSSSNAHQLVAEAFVRVFKGFSPSMTSLETYQKQLDVHLRALKTLFVDLVSVTSGRSTGAHLKSNGPTEGTNHGGRTWKGKEKASDTEMVEAGEAQTIDEDSPERLLGILYDLSPSSSSSTGFLGPSSFSSSPAVSRLSPTLDALLELLFEASQPDHAGSRLSGTSQRMRISDHICTLLSKTMLETGQRAISEGGRGKETLSALRRLVEFGPEKVQEGALNALTAVIRNSHVALLTLLEIGGPGTTIAERLQPFLALAQSPTPSLRLAAFSFCVTASKLQPSSTTTALDPSILLAIIEKEPALRGSAAETFVQLVSSDPVGQKRAALAHCFDTFRKVFESIPSLAETYRTGAPLAEHVATRNGILRSLVSLTAESETNRRLLLDAKLLPHILESLLYPVVPIRAEAGSVVRALSRSVNVLRTDLVEANAGAALIQLLRADEDEVVQTIATAVFANLLLEFSPMRKILIDAGCIERLCRLALEGENQALQQNALWAIKNAVYQSSKEFKQHLLGHLSWTNLAEFSDPKQNPLLVEQALGIIRNITCVTRNEVLDALDDYGEDEILELLQKQFVGGNASTEAVVQSLYCLNNIATAGEASQLAIASRTQILRYLLFNLDHPSGRIRTASLWVIHNLVYRRGSFPASASPRQRRPHEIVEKFRVLGIEGKLRALERDPELDVRERVRDIKEVM